jgi:hypothetical protein
MNYIEGLEKQNDELQQRLAQALLWEPEWVKLPLNGFIGGEAWNLTNGFFQHARILFNSDGKNAYYIKIMNNNQVAFIESTLEAAKAKAMLELSRRHKIRDVSRSSVDKDWTAP